MNESERILNSARALLVGTRQGRQYAVWYEAAGIARVFATADRTYKSQLAEVAARNDDETRAMAELYAAAPEMVTNFVRLVDDLEAVIDAQQKRIEELQLELDRANEHVAFLNVRTIESDPDDCPGNDDEAYPGEFRG